MSALSQKKHSKIDGVYEIKYQIPKEYRVIRGPKTVYDPKVISDDQMYKSGKEAMNNVTKVSDRLVEGTASNGLKFKGWLDDVGDVKNFYPIIE